MPLSCPRAQNTWTKALAANPSVLFAARLRWGREESRPVYLLILIRLPLRGERTRLGGEGRMRVEVVMLVLYVAELALL